MGSSWKVLHVDDDSNHHDDITRILSSKMGENTFDFTYTSSFDEGKDLIEKNRFDLIFLDVHEEDTEPAPATEMELEDSKQRGEIILEEIRKSRFIPVIFYTGYPKKVIHNENQIVKVVEKGTDVADIRAAVNSILNTQLPHLAKYIEEKSREYIWDCLEKSLKPNVEITSEITLLAARNLAKNLSQESVKKLIGAELDKIDPLEMYLFPPEKGIYKPTDVLKCMSDNTLWMILTPACDFEQCKAENILLAKVIPIKEDERYKLWEEKLQEEKAIETQTSSEKSESEKNTKKARGEVMSLVKNRIGYRYKFLPGTFFMEDSILDFQTLMNIPNSDLMNYEKLCSLDSPYTEEILQLFSNYYGRIGTPDYSFEPIWKKIENDFLSK